MEEIKKRLTTNRISMMRFTSYIMQIILASSLLVACNNDFVPEEGKSKALWNPPAEFHLIDKEEHGSLKHLKVIPDLDSLPIHQLVYVAVNIDIYIKSKQMRLPLTNTLCIRNISVDYPIIINHVEYYDADGIKLREYLDHAVELKPLQSIWLIIDGKEELGNGTGTNFIVDWASMHPIRTPIIESMMAGSSYQMGFSYKSESVVVKEWRYGVMSNLQ